MTVFVRSRRVAAADRIRGCVPAVRRDDGALARFGGRAAAGFTLVEVLLATVLLAAGLTLAFATLSAATRTAARGEAIAQRNERERAVENFLRKRLAAVRPIPYAVDGSTGVPQRFFGEPDRMRFVADLPDYLGRGGPYLHDLAIEDGNMSLSLAMVLAGQTVEEDPPRPPEMLVEGLKSARFRYRTLGDDGELGEWLERWPAPEQLPLLVEVTMTDADDREWPPLVVALPLAGTTAGGIVTPQESL